MTGWARVSLVGPAGGLRAPGQLARELAGDRTPVLLTDHRFGTLVPYARLLCGHLAATGRPWAIEADLAVAREPALLRLARASGCRALLLVADPRLITRDPAGRDRVRDAAAELRRIRRAGLLTVLDVALGAAGDDAGVFGRAVALCSTGRVAFPRLHADPSSTMSADEMARGLGWASRSLHRHRTIWHRTGLAHPVRRAAMVANYRVRRQLRAAPTCEPTPAMRLARALARPIRMRERVPFVSTLVGAVHASGEQVRSAWLRARAVRDETVAALVIRLEGAIDAPAARTLVARIRRTLGRTPERIVIDLGGIELVSLTVLTRFLEEHAGLLAGLRGRLAFRNLRPALAAVRDNLHGMLPNAALLEQALDETS
jgi:hypothetical protein